MARKALRIARTTVIFEGFECGKIRMFSSVDLVVVLVRRVNKSSAGPLNVMATMAVVIEKRNISNLMRK